MTSREIIDSGILELYVYGSLQEQEMNEVETYIKQYPEVAEEVFSIEKAVINLSQSVAPHLSAANYEKIRKQLIDKHKTIDLNAQNSWKQYMGWAAAAVFVLGMGWQFMKLNDSNETINQLSVEKSKMQESVVELEIKSKEAETLLNVVRDNNNVQVALAGQAVSPTSSAKAYYNKQTKEVYVDVSGLPAPPKGKVYQVWALKLTPLTPTSIGTLDNYTADSSTLKMFKVDNAESAEAFGITLEPAGGSKSPTLEQLYTLGKV